MVVRSQVPLRIDFSGGWTDVDLFSLKAGGAALNATINHYVVAEVDLPEDQSLTDLADLEARFSYPAPIPPESGLGVSAAVYLAQLGLLWHSKELNAEERIHLARLAYNAETTEGHPTGRQDHIAGALGGFHFICFEDEVLIDPLDLTSETIAELENRLILCYSGQPQSTKAIYDNVWGAYQQGSSEVINALYGLRDCAYQMCNALQDNDWWQFADLMNLNWTYQKALDYTVTNAQIDRFFEVAFGSGAIAGKACGAGSGGCLLFLCGLDTRAHVSQELHKAGALIIDFKFDLKGLQISK